MWHCKLQVPCRKVKVEADQSGDVIKIADWSVPPLEPLSPQSHQGSIQDFFAISARNATITKKCLKGSVQNMGGGGGGVQLVQCAVDVLMG